MNKKIQKQWVAALRSGKYKQGKGFLRPDNNEYCCLGVLCKLAEKAKIGKFINRDFFTNHILKNSDSDVLPKSVMKWAGLRNCEGFKYKGETLVNYNDKLSYSFKQIADIIEKK